MRDFCETLYCAYAPVDAFVVGDDRAIRFVATVTDAGRTAEYHVAFEGVREFTRGGERAVTWEPGDRLELSVIELEREANGWRAWFNPWYLEEIEFRCARITLDGRAVTGDGRWLQDWLPSQRAV